MDYVHGDGRIVLVLECQSFQEELTITLALWSRIIVKKVPSKVKNGSTVTDLHVLMAVLHNNQG